ncbi:MAG TPA: hypothetical protein PLA71_01055 [Saccharofermentans sp.]|nr:hypothetical protein [Saccharofermentans sp.]
MARLAVLLKVWWQYSTPEFDLDYVQVKELIQDIPIPEQSSFRRSVF